MYCENCGLELSDDAQFCPHCGKQIKTNSVATAKGSVANSRNLHHSNALPKNMSVWRLVSGIITLVLAMFVLFQSCAAGLFEIVILNKSIGTIIRPVMIIILIAVGIVSIAARDYRGCNIALIPLCAIGSSIGFIFHKDTFGFIIWAAWFLLLMVAAILSLVLWKKE